MLPVSGLLGEEHEPHRRARRGEPALRRERDAVVADLGRPRDDAEQHRGEGRAQRDHARRDARLGDEREQLAAVRAERAWRRAREAPEGGVAGRARDRGRGDLADAERRERCGDADRRADEDRDQPDPHRRREQPAAQVVAPAQEERARADVLRRRDQGQRGGRGHRPGEILPAEQRVGDRREREQDDGRERAADELDLERPPEEPVEPSPVLRRDVAEAELREALLDRQVEQRLGEPDDGHHGREAAEILEAENPRRGDRSEDAERDREVEPGRGREPAPEDARGHRDGSV